MSRMFEELRRAEQGSRPALPHHKAYSVSSAFENTLAGSGRSIGREGRIGIAIPLAISGKDKDGHAFNEDSRTIFIAKHGILIEVNHQLAFGAEISIENRALGLTSPGRVIWCASEPSLSTTHRIGIYVHDPERLCGVR